MITKTYSATVQGVDAQLISIEVNIVSGTKLFMVGLPDNAIKESQHRIESVLKHIDKYVPRQRVIVNLAPAHLKKEGSAYDLPIALAMLHASKQAFFGNLDQYLIAGELALDGQLRPIRGALPMAIQAQKKGLKGFLLPKENSKEAAIVHNLAILPISHIQEAMAFLSGKKEIAPLRADVRTMFTTQVQRDDDLDLADIQGQLVGKKALEIAAAGGHNLLMIGSPGVGKSMLAKRLPSILPPLTLREALETTKVYSVVGSTGHRALMTKRPFRTPHHTTSEVALVGGGSIPQPGEISLAHHGVLCLEELTEFKRSVLEVLRQPLEDKRISITRAKLSLDFPANFMLVATMNPCPCGYYTHPDKPCTCHPTLRRRYLNKISGPLLDRIDIHLHVDPVQLHAETNPKPPVTSAEVRARVVAARKRQQARFAAYPHVYCNAMMTPKLMHIFCKPSRESKALIKEAMIKIDLSARAYDRILKVARTIADLDDKDVIQPFHVAQAIYFRSLDRGSWGN